ncbi:zinc finger protein 180-like isoform X1 [Entelurus aequoreus]|uniref:zinc finger protein 180-like isoform X1 n=1 Tax=Entelurus aequoreus TaxID=161455 RepID=UPI002B1E48B4|nr:zinc finger protein 180-like isoform X1 [Entelurus aequoreus]
MCERTIAKYEEELCPTKEKKERQHQLLDAVFQKHRVVLHRTDIQQPPHIKEEEEDPQPPHMKEEEEEVWITQEGECLLGQEEDDVTKFPLTVVSVKTEEHEDKPPESSQLHHSPNIQRVSAGSHEEEWHTSVGQKELQAPSHIKEEQLHDEDEAQSLQLHHSQSEENRGAELVSQHLTEADGERCEDIKSEPDSIFAPLSDMDHMMSDSSDHSDHIQKPLESKNDSKDVQRVSAGSHEEIPSGQREWHTSVGQKELQAPSHIKEEQLHDEDEAQSLQLHHSQSEENRGAELVSQHITEADGEHCEDIKSEPDSIFAPLSDMDHMMSDSSDHSDHIQKPLESKNDSKGDTRHHTNNKHFDCSECGKSFKQKSNFTAHMRTHTGEKPFTCSVCKKSFSIKQHMTRHMRTHTGEKPFTCSVCKKSFSIKQHMTTHMRTHTGEKPFSCSVCEKSFSRKLDMTTHMRTHTGEKPFICSVCKKSFSRKRNMTTHQMKSHTGEKPFPCSLCPKRFSINQQMKRHMRTHTGEKPFSCTVCVKTFRFKNQVSKHKCVKVMEAAGI